MLQVLFKNAVGTVTKVVTDLNELATTLNDQAILSQTSITRLLDYIARNHFHTKMGGIPYYLSNVSMGVEQPVTIVFTELNQPNVDVQYRVILKDRAGNDILDNVMDKVGIAAMLNDQSILNITDEAQLELYLISHHYLTQINGNSFIHTQYSVGVGQIPTFVFKQR